MADWSYAITDGSHYLGPYSDNFGFIDWNGDDHKDVYVGMVADLDTISYVYIFIGPSFGSSPDVILSAPAEMDSIPVEYFAEGVFNAGDIDADGWEDLGVDYGRRMLIYLCGSSVDASYDYRLTYRYSRLAAAGDVNGDGHNDLVAGLSQRSSFGGVEVYLGGTKWDVYPDGFLGRYDLPPLLLEQIGRRVAAAGDFNGDGIDDFMFSCSNFADGHQGDVFVAKGGTDIGTAVYDHRTGSLPDELRVLPNYPNPFNPNTTVVFELARACPVTVNVLNILGQRVTTLAEGVRLGSGRHSYAWDGMLAEGSPAPSGVYFFQVITPTTTGTQKMMLIR